MKSQPAEFMEARDQALEGGKESHKKNPQEPLMRQSSWSVQISNSTFFCQIYWVLLEFILLSTGVCGDNLREKNVYEAKWTRLMRWNQGKIFPTVGQWSTYVYNTPGGITNPALHKHHPSPQEELSESLLPGINWL